MAKASTPGNTSKHLCAADLAALPSGKLLQQLGAASSGPPSLIGDATETQNVVLDSEMVWSENDLENMCHEDMKCGMWDEKLDVSEKFKTNAGGAIMAALIGKYYFRDTRHTQHIFSDPLVHGAAFGPWAQEQTTEWGVLLLRRAPDNDRNEKVSRANYKAGILKIGFNLQGRSPMMLWPVPPHLKWTNDPRARFVYAAATCWEAWTDAKIEEPNNPQVTISERTGFPGCIDLRARTTKEIRVWCVNEWNSHQRGSAFNVQQYCNRLVQYKVGFKAHMDKNGWNDDSFGTGAASRDSRTWEWLVDTYKASGELRLKDINEYNHSSTFITQIKKQEVYDLWQDVIANSLDHLHPQFDIHVYTGRPAEITVGGPGFDLHLSPLKLDQRQAKFRNAS